MTKGAMKKFLIALQFLTIFPVRIPGRIKEEEAAASLAYFPLIGLIIGLILAAISQASGFLPPAVIISIIIASLIMLTGGLHLDGFADTCDGLYAGRTKESSLEIMRDPHIGTMGAAAIAVLFLFKFTVLLNIPEENLWKALIIAPVFAKNWLVLACYKSKYAREEGKAKLFIEKAKLKNVITASLISLAVILALGQIKGVTACLISSFFLFLFVSYIKKRIGGMTGDMIGAVHEAAEVLFLFLFLILCRA